MVAQAVVRTSGINVESFTATLAGMTVILGFLGAAIARYVGKQVNNLGDKLELKLETKDVVSSLTTRVAVLEKQLMDSK